MKSTTKVLAGAAALAFATLTTGQLQAQVTNAVTISFTAALADDQITDKNGVTTIPAPIKHSVNTATVLSWLAYDETSEGDYGADEFPNGAKLVVVSGSSPDFQVLDKKGNLIVDVSNLLTVTNSGYYASEVESGKISDADPDLSDPTTADLRVQTVIYDDSEASGNYKFAFSGVINNVTTDSKPTSTGAYKETQDHTISSGQGAGYYGGEPFVVTGGSLKASGSGELNTNTPVD